MFDCNVHTFMIVGLDSIETLFSCALLFFSPWFFVLSIFLLRADQLEQKTKKELKMKEMKTRCSFLCAVFPFPNESHSARFSA